MALREGYESLAVQVCDPQQPLDLRWTCHSCPMDINDARTLRVRMSKSDLHLQQELNSSPFPFPSQALDSSNIQGVATKHQQRCQSAWESFPRRWALWARQNLGPEELAAVLRTAHIWGELGDGVQLDMSCLQKPAASPDGSMRVTEACAAQQAPPGWPPLVGFGSLPRIMASCDALVKDEGSGGALHSPYDDSSCHCLHCTAHQHLLCHAGSILRIIEAKHRFPFVMPQSSAGLFTYMGRSRGPQGRSAASNLPNVSCRCWLWMLTPVT